jgi:hypothetical protein
VGVADTEEEGGGLRGMHGMGCGRTDGGGASGKAGWQGRAEATPTTDGGG